MSAKSAHAAQWPYSITFRGYSMASMMSLAGVARLAVNENEPMQTRIPFRNLVVNVVAVLGVALSLLFSQPDIRQPPCEDQVVSSQMMQYSDLAVNPQMAQSSTSPIPYFCMPDTIQEREYRWINEKGQRGGEIRVRMSRDGNIAVDRR